jgi:hypothetical protein
MLNFLPTNPYGLIASVPASTDCKQTPFFREMLVTDGRFFYHQQNRPVSAVDYRAQAMATLQASAARLPIRVEGEVAWTVVRLDAKHVRVTLVDPGYISPAEREATIVLQHLRATSCRDILRGESLPLSGDRLRLTVPAGIVRIVDIAHD